MISSIHFMGLAKSLESPEFTGLEVQSSMGQPKVMIEPLHGEGSGKTFLVHRQKGTSSQVVDSSEVVSTVSALFNESYETAICSTKREQFVYTRTNKGVRIKSEPVPAQETSESTLKFEVKDLLESPSIRRMLIELGVLTDEVNIRREQFNKLIQVKNLLSVIYDVLPQLRERQPLNIVDAACGKSYLSFVLYHFLREEWKLDARFQCIDTNSRLIDRCRQIQNKLSYSDMEFLVSNINGFKSNDSIDMLYSLHGCDTASDEAISAGVRLNSQVIIVVPCCHFELRNQLRHHPLKGITKYGLFEERFAALLTDALRALALEAVGYEVTIFRFVTDDISPKNTLLRAFNRQSPKQQSLKQFNELRDTFGVSPAIERLLSLARLSG